MMADPARTPMLVGVAIATWREDDEDREQDDAPDVCIAPKDELRHAVELRAGLTMPVGLFATMGRAAAASAC